ncbi:DUF5666 domain-containing protein [Mycobacteroides abscessus]|uniref:DUF5666 domain-containing protein n=1 Tax=Mycobacteroides abscessus TaxID=36809 RepID=UPI0009A868C9|nr:DUF5666 domain-containing protein [Mycobacteroides abscessus]MBN7434763.1 hypothetical protein [Mycobacteroides abscessus subsp. abscessus]MDM1886235.1 DUF5666 domain-containing protein [Mycobacteroides abscessus]MDM1889567.1 DUF5666 domain-containing protein [Mycobacteroides abscessus]MDO3109401.1 DUF5666 domain-containing protein [Mycobacteroides abscessus subsp. abscessus]RIR63249.1 hypothetical protein D2E62_16560 [Mycobacteroides abscessus]
MTPTRTLAQPRFARGALLAFAGLTAFSVAACGTHGDTNAASTRSSAPTTSSSAPHGEHNEKGHVSGLIVSVSGNSVEVTKQNGNATVSFGQSTKVSEIFAAQLSDVTAGSCIAAMTPPDSNPPTARRVMMWPSADGSCVREHPKEQQSTSPAPTSGKRPEHEGIRGTVASVSGNAITVTGTDPNGTATGPTTVTVNNDTTYAKRAPVDQNAIATGKCMAAHGTDDASGNLQATSITLRAARDGSCDGGGHEGHHQR